MQIYVVEPGVINLREENTRIRQPKHLSELNNRKSPLKSFHFSFSSFLIYRTTCFRHTISQVPLIYVTKALNCIRFSVAPSRMVKSMVM